MINFLHLSALLSLTSALCLQRNAKKMNGANISPSFYSFFIFFSIFVFVLLLLPSFLSILPFFLSFFPILFFFLLFFLCLFFLSLSLFRFVFPCVPILIPPFLFLLFLFLLFLFLLFLFLLFCSSFFSVPPFSVPLFLFLLLSFLRRVRSTAKVPYRPRQASSQILCPLSQSTISVRNLTRHASLCLLHCRLLCKL